MNLFFVLRGLLERLPFWPARSPWPRYRVTPRVNPATLRCQLRLAIWNELRRSGIDPRRFSGGGTH